MKIASSNKRTLAQEEKVYLLLGLFTIGTTKGNSRLRLADKMVAVCFAGTIWIPDIVL